MSDGGGSVSLRRVHQSDEAEEDEIRERFGGRLAEDVSLAWLEIDGRVECSRNDPSFELVTEDGVRIRVHGVRT
jgi:hypothetical protein